MGWRISTAFCFAIIALIPPSGMAAEEDRTPPDASAVEFFEKNVRPVLAERCQTCHGERKQKANLRLDSREALLKGGETGPAAVPGNPGESLLVEAIKYGDALQMPPKSRLPERDVAALTKWVEMGLPWPKEATVSPASNLAKPAFDLQGRRKGHWAWQGLRPVVSPDVKNPSWPNVPEDRFILAKLESQGLDPAPEAAPETLIRRLSFDLTGLPPLPDETESYVKDSRPDAYERLVDRLLSSPRYGERWARHWMDLVRYAETRGHEFDPIIPNAWQYRDYLVRALNADVPYNTFLTEHLAGDLTSPPRIDPSTGANESILGTGFWFLGEEVHSPVDIRQDECDRLDNRLDVMSKTFLSLTVACARCHDHKFDAISQRDYYALSGFLISSTYRQARFATMERERKAAEALQALQEVSRRRIHRIIASTIRTGIDRLPHNLVSARNCLVGGEGANKLRDDPEVKGWIEALTQAKADTKDPFHLFAKVACSPHSDDPRAFANELDGLLLADRETRSWSSSKEQSKVVTSRTSFEEISDLARFQNGYAFGLRSAAAGDVVVEGNSANPSLGLSIKNAARFDPLFQGFKSSEGNERDQGRMGTWNREGQTLRTKEFTIGSGILYYLAKGAGHAYASVNSHLIVAGPLHAHVLTEWTDGGKGWRWVRHDLSVYAGHRAHIEFSPSGPGEFAIANVIESNRTPQLSERLDILLAEAISPAKVTAAVPLARIYQSLFRELADRLEKEQVSSEYRQTDAARLGDYVLHNPLLFAPADSAPIKELNAETLRIVEQRRAIAASLPKTSPTAPAMMDGNSVDEHLLIRGSARTPGPLIPRRLLEAISGESAAFEPESGSGRLQLARQMTDPSNPFASRVIVNRIWHHLFGRGIVASVDNFGVLGEPPTHPELLDYLADRFIKEDWSQKRLIRSLVMSRTYRMSSRTHSTADLADPKNLLLHRREVRRLEAEPIRDAILAVSGRLDGRIGGPSVPVHLTSAMQGRGRPTQSGPSDGDGRRSLYLGIRRNFLAPMMLAYDAPIPFNCVGRRNVSNVPSQALILMNDPFVVEQARLWSDGVFEKAETDSRSRITSMYRQAFVRRPTSVEIEDALAFLESQARESGLPTNSWETDRRVWADFAHMLFNAKEFVFVD